MAHARLERGRITIRGEVAKNRGGRGLRGLRSVIWRAARRAKIVGVSPHVLRHTWATRFMQSGGDLRTLQRLGGWKRIEMVQRYAHSDDGLRLGPSSAWWRPSQSPRLSPRLPAWSR